MEFAKEIGEPENIRITALEVSGCHGERTLITVANGPGFELLMRESGVSVISAFDSRRITPQEWIVAAQGSDEVLLIPHDIHGHERHFCCRAIAGSREESRCYRFILTTAGLGSNLHTLREPQ